MSQPSTTPVDSVLNGVINGIAERGRGFALNLEKELDADQKTLRISVEQPAAKHDEWRPPADLRKHTIRDAESFVAYATRYGDKDKSLILFDTNSVTLTIDEGLGRGDREIVT